jgi:hypothetical protein
MTHGNCQFFSSKITTPYCSEVASILYSRCLNTTARDAFTVCSDDLKTVKDSLNNGRIMHLETLVQ